MTPIQSRSLWQDTLEMPKFTHLNKDLDCDVCVIGGGLGGLLTAYLLQKEKKKVVLLESQTLGAGQTGFSTAHFTTALDDRYSHLEKIFSLAQVKMAAESHLAAIKEIERIVFEEDIDCDLERVHGYLFTSPYESLRALSSELLAAHRAGLSDVEMIPQAPLEQFDTDLCLVFPNQIQLHPLKLLKGLANVFSMRGGQIYTHTSVGEVHGGSKSYVKTRDGFLVRAQSIVVATNTPINDLVAIHTKQASYRTYVVAFRIPKGSVTRGLYWDTGNPYHYIRTAPLDHHSDYLIVGGEDHKTGQKVDPGACLDHLEKWTRDRFHMAQEVLYQWSGQVMEPVDSLGFLGRNPGRFPNVYMISGDSGNGMTHCVIGGLIITDQILERKNPWEKLYDPSRISLKAIPRYVKENINTLAQYGDWMEVVPPRNVYFLSEEEGGVINDGMRKIAVYRNKEGHLELFSATCPHLGGVVRWNSVEKSWDCPCHGSRFNCHGKVIEGPAAQDLARIKGSQIHNQEKESTI